MTEQKKAVVAGGLGLIGRALVDHFTQFEDWDVVAISRRRPDFATKATFLSLDLLDPAAIASQQTALAGATHLFYAAWIPQPNAAAEVGPNLAMLKNIVEATERASSRLEHVNFMQGSKVYGAHVAPYKTPARETDPRIIPPMFYYDQEDYVVGRQLSSGWNYSILRPNSPCGFAVGNPMNLVMVLAVYASISKELGIPLRFPGSPATYSMLYEVTDMDLLARATHWAATDERAQNRIYNVGNGDYFRWEHLWPRIAAFFDMEVGPPFPVRLSERMPQQAAVWDRIVQREGLTPYAYDDLVSWGYGDGRFNREWETLNDTSRIRRDGFVEFVDSEAMFMRIFEDLRSRRVIP